MSRLASLRAEVEPAVAPMTANRQWLQQILRAQREGRGCLPFRLGLDTRQYAALVDNYALTEPSEGLPDPSRPERDALREELLQLRHEEWQALVGLLTAGQAAGKRGEPRMTAIVAAACLGGNHLWRDLGLRSREELRTLLMHNFPLLAMRNVHDMRWKKFFYKQLCEQDGGHVCRAPTCEACPTYPDCFGEER